MHLAIHHETRYEYSEPLEYAHQTLRLTPPADAHQRVRRWRLQAPGPLFAQHDGYGNRQHHWTLARRAARGVVRAEGMVETNAECRLDDEARAVAPPLYLRPTALTDHDDTIAALGRECLRDGVHETALLALAGTVADRVRYRRGCTDVTTTAAEAFSRGEGVCQDQSHVMIAACRSQGIPARYVSGYFYAPDAPRMASHAWVDVCVDVAAGRWLSVDPTHRCLMDERHVRLAVGPDYAACSPIRGVRSGGGDEEMNVEIRISPERDEVPGPVG